MENQRNYGVPKHHVILDLIQSSQSDYNNLKNHAPSPSPKLESSYAKFNGKKYSFASGEYSVYYPDLRLEEDNTALAANKNAILVKGISSIGLPKKRKSFRMVINIRMKIKKNYSKLKGREYDTEITPIYRWMNKEQDARFTCVPDFKFKKGTDKSTWYYGDTNINKVRCLMVIGNRKKNFSFNAGKGDMYFLNLVIYSDDGTKLYFGEASSGNSQRIKLHKKECIFPKKTDFHLFGGIKEPILEEPSPYLYDYELINVHTGFASERIRMKRKKGFEKYKLFKNRPTVSLGTSGLDAISCKGRNSTSFWNGKNFACQKYAITDTQRTTKLTNESDALTRNEFKDYSCNRHKTFKSDGSCANCPKN